MNQNDKVEDVKENLMSTTQIKKYKDNQCRHPEHNPPSMQVFEPGEYKHTCPRCGEVTNFSVPLITC
jgi:hypothetical protein